MKHWFKKTAIAGMVIAALSQSVGAAGLQAQINTGTVASGDSFQLTLTTDDTATSAPDLSPLDKDFVVLGTSQSSQTQVINGRRSSQVSWIVTLTPRSKGDLTIPVLQAGALSSEAGTIKVVDASEMPKSVGADGVSISAKLAEGSHYIYQEIPLTVRIETGQNLQQAELSAPQGSDFELEPQGEDRSSQVVRNGQAINVIERDYLLRPQKSGALSLPPFVLQGAIADPNARRDPFADFGFGSSMMREFGGIFSQGKAFQVRTDAIALDVLDNPNAGKESWFLPAKQVKLEAQWVDDDPEFKVGEAVTRRISLLALGAQPEQLPKLELGQAQGAKLYIDDTSTDVVQTREGSVARREMLVSVVPTSGGEVILPEISVQWHDTQANQQRTAVLPAEVIRVAGAVTLPATPKAAASPVANADKTGQLSTETAGTDNTHLSGDYLRKILPAFFGMFLLGFAGFVFYRRQQQENIAPAAAGKTKTAPRKISPSESPADKALAQLQKAVKSADARSIYSAILSWQQARQDHELPGSLKQEIQKLEQALFGETGEQADTTAKKWDTTELKRMLPQLKNRPVQSVQDRALPPLYPAH